MGRDEMKGGGRDLEWRGDRGGEGDKKGSWKATVKNENK